MKSKTHDHSNWSILHRITQKTKLSPLPTINWTTSNHGLKHSAAAGRSHALHPNTAQPQAVDFIYWTECIPLKIQESRGKRRSWLPELPQRAEKRPRVGSDAPRTGPPLVAMQAAGQVKKSSSLSPKSQVPVSWNQTRRGSYDRAQLALVDITSGVRGEGTEDYWRNLGGGCRFALYYM